MLTHRIRTVGPILSKHVEHLWLVRGYLSRPWRNMILPDGAIELIVSLGDPQKLRRGSNGTMDQMFRESWISGERISPIVIDELGKVDLIGARLRPGGAWPFLGVPVREFTDQVVELESVFGREIHYLREQMGEAENDDARFDLLEAWLLERLRGRPAGTRAVSYTLTLLACGRGCVRIGQIAHEVGISHKHLLREFDRCVGLAPKLFARLCAFQRVIQTVGHKPRVDWADTAAICGFYDQAHLIREFQAFSGLTPAEYLSRRGPFLNYLAVE
jgi:AraC-like DNA-binding protein